MALVELEHTGMIKTRTLRGIPGHYLDPPTSTDLWPSPLESEGVEERKIPIKGEDDFTEATLIRTEKGLSIQDPTVPGWNGYTIVKTDEHGPGRCSIVEYVHQYMAQLFEGCSPIDRHAPFYGIGVKQVDCVLRGKRWHEEGRDLYGLEAPQKMEGIEQRLVHCKKGEKVDRFVQENQNLSESVTISHLLHVLEYESNGQQVKEVRLGESRSLGSRILNRLPGIGPKLAEVKLVEGYLPWNVAFGYEIKGE